MMLYLYVQQNRWIFITILCAIAVVLLFCLTYQAMWTPRGTEEKSETIEVKDFRSFLLWLRSFMPWVLILLILAPLAFTIVKVLQNACTPPNW